MFRKTRLTRGPMWLAPRDHGGLIHHCATVCVCVPRRAERNVQDADTDPPCAGLHVWNVCFSSTRHRFTLFCSCFSQDWRPFLHSFISLTLSLYPPDRCCCPGVTIQSCFVPDIVLLGSLTSCLHVSVVTVRHWAVLDRPWPRPQVHGHLWKRNELVITEGVRHVCRLEVMMSKPER